MRRGCSISATATCSTGKRRQSGRQAGAGRARGPCSGCTPGHRRSLTRRAAGFCCSISACAGGAGRSPMICHVTPWATSFADTERPRVHLGIERWLLWGASWGPGPGARDGSSPATAPVAGTCPGSSRPPPAGPAAARAASITAASPLQPAARRQHHPDPELGSHRHTRRSVASGSPAIAFSRPSMVAVCNGAPTLSIAPRSGVTLEEG